MNFPSGIITFYCIVFGSVLYVFVYISGPQMAAQERPIPVRLLQPSKTTSSGSATSLSTVTSSTDDTSTVLSSQWSEKRHQMYQLMTPDEQELFDELQREIEELRKLLGGKKNQHAVDKVGFSFSLIIQLL